ncbi:MAG: hypothetical protein AAF683_12245 [Pseudomonadota bacterium]
MGFSQTGEIGSVIGRPAAGDHTPTIGPKPAHKFEANTAIGSSNNNSLDWSLSKQNRAAAPQFAQSMSASICHGKEAGKSKSPHHDDAGFFYLITKLVLYAAASAGGKRS